MNYTVAKNNYLISTDKSKIDIDYVHRFLTRSYWSPGIHIQVVKKAMEGSLCFGIYESDEQNPRAEKQVGYARMITDEATFAYLADVFIDEDYRGKGLGNWLIEMILAHPKLQVCAEYYSLQRMHINYMNNVVLQPSVIPKDRWYIIHPMYKNK